MPIKMHKHKLIELHSIISVQLPDRGTEPSTKAKASFDMAAAAATRSLHSFLVLLLLLPAAAAAASSSYETKSIDPGLVVMTLPEPVTGPESLAFDGRGGGPYSGVSDGRILRWQGRLRGWTEFAYNSKHKSAIEHVHSCMHMCPFKNRMNTHVRTARTILTRANVIHSYCRSMAVCAPDKKLVVPESLCGRPLGLQFHRRSGDLYIADAYLGLLRVSARGGLAEVVATEAGGEPFNFLNGLDVDQRTGDVYFTDSSTTYRRRYVQAN